jgi:hypothetical protein
MRTKYSTNIIQRIQIQSCQINTQIYVKLTLAF